MQQTPTGDEPALGKLLACHCAIHGPGCASHRADRVVAACLASVKTQTQTTCMYAVGASFSMGNIERDEVVLARELCRALSDLGPTFVKLGQLMSSRSDLLSPGVAKELSRLQSKVPPFSDAAALQACPRCMLFAALAGLTRPPFAVADQTIREELGCPIGDVFSEISSVNVASASLAQVSNAAGNALPLARSGELSGSQLSKPVMISIHSLLCLPGVQGKAAHWRGGCCEGTAARCPTNRGSGSGYPQTRCRLLQEHDFYPCKGSGPCR